VEKEDLCRSVVVEGILRGCFINPLIYDYVRDAMKTLYDKALNELIESFRSVFEKEGYDSICVNECCTFTKALAKPIYMCFSPWPRQVYVGDVPGGVKVVVIQGIPAQSILQYLEERQKSYYTPLKELWVFVEGDKLLIALNTYKAEDHQEVLRVLRNNFLVNFIGEREVEVKPPTPPPTIPPSKRVESHIRARPSREVLEGIVASVLEDLGFRVSTNVRLPAKGGEVEVDVWAFKSVVGSQFRVYVSCKNWDRDVDRHVVDQEFGRVLQLDYMPHLRVLIVKGLTEPARKAALDDGFMVIELGRKADAENSKEIYEIVYRAFNELFTAIAPPRLREIAEKLAEIRENLRRVEEEITRLLYR
jgi:hypothetical protein